MYLTGTLPPVVDQAHWTLQGLSISVGGSTVVGFDALHNLDSSSVARDHRVTNDYSTEAPRPRASVATNQSRLHDISSLGTDTNVPRRNAGSWCESFENRGLD